MEHLEHIGPGMREIFGLVNLLVVIAIIYFGARKGISAAVRGRSEDLSKKLVEARNELDRMKAEIAKSHREVKDIQKTKQAMIDQVEEEGRRMGKALVEEAKKSADRILADTKLAAENEVRVAGSELRKKLVTEALRQSTELVKPETPGSDAIRSQIHERLVEKFLTETPKGVSNGH